MDLSRFKVEAYDLLAVLLPGLILICEVWITIRGWTGFATRFNAISASVFAFLILLAFAFGQIIQELGDLTIKRIRGSRFFKTTRDRLWSTSTGQQVRTRIHAESGDNIEDVDVAFDYCLTKVQSQFSKRDLFLASSDLARSLVVLSLLALAPSARIAFGIPVQHRSVHWLIFSGMVVLCLFVASLSWIRMKRFRALSESPVFHSYLAQSTRTSPKSAATGSH